MKIQRRALKSLWKVISEYYYIEGEMNIAKIDKKAEAQKRQNTQWS